MNELHPIFADFARWFWPALLNHLWQSTVFALFIWAAVGLLRQAPAKVRSQLWLLALVKFCLPLALLSALVPESGIQIIEASSASASAFIHRATSPVTQAIPVAHGQSLQAHTHTYCWLTIAWMVGLVFVFWVRIIMSWWATRRLRRSVRLRENSLALQRVARISARLGIKRQVELVVSSAVESPCVLGWRKPVLFLPAEIQDDLTQEEWEAVLAHELSHVKRRDNLVGWVSSILCCVYWFFPAVWLIERRVRAEREFACDEAVLAVGAEPKTYASGLWKVARHGLGWLTADVSQAAGPHLQRRIEHMLYLNSRLRLTGAQRATVVLTLFSLTGLLAFATVIPAGRITPRVNAQSADSPRLEVTDYWNAPVKIRQVLSGDEALSAKKRMGELEDWLKPLKVEVESVSEKKITSVIFAVDFSPVDKNAPHIRYTFAAGRSIFALYQGLEGENLLDLNQGQRCTASADKTWNGQEGIRELVKKQLSITKVELFVETVVFADETAWMFGKMMKPISPGSPNYEPIKN